MRGSGKSTLVEKALCTHPHTIFTSYVEGGINQWAQKVLFDLRRCQRVYLQDESLGLLTDAFRSVQSPHPTVVIEVDSRCTPMDLEKLLLHLKSLGADAEIARFIVVLSLSRAAAFVKIGSKELRCHYFEVGDLTEDEITSYLMIFFSERFTETSHVKAVSTYAVGQLSGRLIHLREFVSTGASTCFTSTSAH